MTLYFVNGGGSGGLKTGSRSGIKIRISRPVKKDAYGGIQYSVRDALAAQIGADIRDAAEIRIIPDGYMEGVFDVHEQE